MVPLACRWKAGEDLGVIPAPHAPCPHPHYVHVCSFTGSTCTDDPITLMDRSETLWSPGEPSRAGMTGEYSYRTIP